MIKDFFIFGNQRANYWSCSKFAFWVHKKAGAKKLKCGTMEEWDSYKNEHPNLEKIDDVLDFIQDLLNYPFDLVNRIRIYFDNLLYQSHSAKTSLSKGAWHETDERLLYCMFGLLEQFVENELASM